MVLKYGTTARVLVGKDFRNLQITNIELAEFDSIRLAIAGIMSQYAYISTYYPLINSIKISDQAHITEKPLIYTVNMKVRQIFGTSRNNPFTISLSRFYAAFADFVDIIEYIGGLAEEAIDPLLYVYDIIDFTVAENPDMGS